MKKKKPSAQRTVLQRVTLVLYIIAVAVSLVVVIAFVSVKLFAPPPDVSKEVEIPVNTTNPPDSSGSVTDDPNVTDPPDTLTFHRRDGVYTCLLLGVADIGGSDTIMLGVLDTGKKTASLISIPRDTVVNYKGELTKINAVYSYGGVEAVRQCVSEMLALPMDFYVTVDTQAFPKIVDRIGGVWFTVPPGMDYEDPLQDLYIHLTPGYQKLNGEDALKLVRCRSAYVSQDFGRAATQREFLKALAKQAFQLYNVDKIPDLVNILKTYVKTDMDLSDMVYFGTQAIGMNLDAALSSTVLSTNWVSPYVVPGVDEVLGLVNSLGVYEEKLPAEALRLVFP